MTAKGNARSSNWKFLYDVAKLESDFSKLPPLLNDTINVVLDRIEETRSPVELDQLNSALNHLRLRRKEISSLTAQSNNFNPNKAA